MTVRDDVRIRRARPGDLAAVDALFARGYPRLLAADYPPSVMVTAVPLLARANPALLRSGTYRVAQDGEGRILAAGGWSAGSPFGAERNRMRAHVRHVVTDPGAVRRGLGRAILEASLDEARESGARVMVALSTRTAEPFYAALGFRRIGAVTIPLRPGIAFPAVRMERPLTG